MWHHTLRTGGGGDCAHKGSHLAKTMSLALHARVVTLRTRVALRAHRAAHFARTRVAPNGSRRHNLRAEGVTLCVQKGSHLAHTRRRALRALGVKLCTSEGSHFARTRVALSAHTGAHFARRRVTLCAPNGGRGHSLRAQGVALCAQKGSHLLHK